MIARSVSQTLAIGAAVLVLAGAAKPAVAHEVETGTVLVCDTKAQAERFVTHFKGNPQEAVGAVNAEENNPSACAFAAIAFVRGSQIGTARSGTAAFEIVPVIALGVNTPAGMQPVAPVPLFTLVPVKEFAV
ncbi:MAG: hypothetical protein QOC56_2216 [Alphaproteobacteria bacterium]|nr:hypothetical protein [Alphaproteobacteria bacterium]